MMACGMYDACDGYDDDGGEKLYGIMEGQQKWGTLSSLHPFQSFMAYKSQGKATE